MLQSNVKDGGDEISMQIIRPGKPLRPSSIGAVPLFSRLGTYSVVAIALVQ
jgi:hypothetical protein